MGSCMASVSQPSPPQCTALPRVPSQAQLSWVLGTTALVPLSASALSLGIIQGDVSSQADVGADGFPEPLAEEGCLPRCRCLREQERAVERGQKWGKVPIPLHSPHTSLFSKTDEKFTVAPHSLSYQAPA